MPGTLVERSRIRLAHLYRLRRLPDLVAPTLFNDLVQLRKLSDRDPRLPWIADKLHAKTFARQILGQDWIVPTIWSGLLLPDRAPASPPFVIKSRHGCNQTIFVRNSAFDWAKITRIAHRWTTKRYGRWLDEWLYSQIAPGLLIEPMIGDGMTLPLDYKFFVFAGRVEFVQVHLDREQGHRWVVFDRTWKRITQGRPDRRLARPRVLPAMIEAAEALGRQFDFVRVDMYAVDDKPAFGEMTFYPGSGLDRFDPPWLDASMGALWIDAKSSLHRGSSRPTSEPSEPLFAGADRAMAGGFCL